MSINPCQNHELIGVLNEPKPKNQPKPPSHKWLALPIIGWIYYALAKRSYRKLENRVSTTTPIQQFNQGKVEVLERAPVVERLVGKDFKSGTSIDQTNLFDELQNDLDRDVVVILPNGKESKTCEEIFTALGKDENALELMVFMQQGATADFIGHLQSTWDLNRDGVIYTWSTGESPRIEIHQNSKGYEVVRRDATVTLSEAVGTKITPLAKVSMTLSLKPTSVVYDWTAKSLNKPDQLFKLIHQNNR